MSDGRRRVVVTGARGFIGQRLCERLRAEGCTVTAVLRRPLSGPWEHILVHDLGESPLPEDAFTGAQWVFHLAARVHHPEDGARAEGIYQSANVTATRHVVAAAERAHVSRLVYFSSVKAMGEQTEGCIDESAPVRPETAYGRSKLAAEGAVLGRERARPPAGVVLRLPAVYGAGCKGQLARMLEAVVRGRFPALPELGNRRSLVHVSDVVEAALAVAGAPEAAGQTYLVTGPAPCSSRQLYDAMRQAAGLRPVTGSVPAWVLGAGARIGDLAKVLGVRGLPLDSEAFRKLAADACYSASKLEREIGFRARVDIGAGLREMMLGDPSGRPRGGRASGGDLAPRSGGHSRPEP